MSSAPPSVYKSEMLLGEIMEALDDAHMWWFNVITSAKNVEASLLDLQAFATGPDRALQGKVDYLANYINVVKRGILIAEAKLRDICLECGWELTYNEDEASYEVTGPCESDEEKGE